MQWLLESAFCLACFYVLYWLLLRHETFFQWNRAYLLITPVLSLALPAFHISVARPDQPAQIINQVVSPEIAPVLMVTRQAPEALEHSLCLPVAQSLTIGEIGVWTYGLVALLLALLLFRRVWMLFRLIRNSKLERHEDFVLAEVPDAGTPAASFFSTIFWKRGQLTENEQFILAHELVHVRQRHSLDVLFMEIIVLLQWFNPLVWMCRRSLQAVHEFIADDYVVRESRQRFAYASLLASQQAAHPETQLFNTFHSQLKIRLFMLSKRPSHWLCQGKYLLVVPLVSALMLLFSFRLIENMPAAVPLLNAITGAEHFVENIAAVPLVSSEKTPQTEPTPYVFYWGVLQARFQKAEATGDYFAEMHTSKAEFQEAIKREPRLWDGQALAPKCSFSIGDIPVNSDYFDAGVYTAVSPRLVAMADQLSDSAQVKISHIALPDGKMGEVFVFFTQGTPKWLRTVPPSRVSVDATSKFSLQWGPEKFDNHAREFFTVDEFWNILQSEPTFIFEDGHVTRPDQWDARLRFKSGAMEATKNSDPGSYKFSLQDVRTWLNGKSNEIQPGASLYFYSWDTSIHPVVTGYDTIAFTFQSQPTTFARLSTGAMIPVGQLDQIQVAEMNIVADDDPRLMLRLTDQKDFEFSWGSFQYTMYNVYDQTYYKPDGSLLRVQTGISTNTNNYIRSQILDMLHLPAKLLDEQGNPLEPLNFSLHYKDQTAKVTNGICPSDFIQMLETTLQPYEELVITDMRAGSSDLGFATFTFSVRNEDPKALLHPSFAPLNAPAAKQLRLMPIPARPAEDQVSVQFFLPEKGHAVFTISNGPGDVLWTHSGTFPKGQNELKIPVSEVKTDKWMVLTLEASGLKVQQQFMILL